MAFDPKSLRAYHTEHAGRYRNSILTIVAMAALSNIFVACLGLSCCTRVGFEWYLPVGTLLYAEGHNPVYTFFVRDFPVVFGVGASIMIGRSFYGLMKKRRVLLAYLAIFCFGFAAVVMCVILWFGTSGIAFFD